MKRIILSIISILLVIQMIGCASEPIVTNEVSSEAYITKEDTEPVISDNTTDTEEEVIPVVGPEDTLTEQQKNSIAMLNYLAMLSQEINSSKNSRLFLEEAYASIINNIKPDRINEGTQARLESLLDIIERYRMIDVKRERLQYLYERNQAKAIKSALPNPISLLNVVASGDKIKMITSLAYMAIDSYVSYTSYTEELNQQFLQDGWELDDDAAENLHENRKATFSYMVEMVRNEELPGNYALNENSIDEFVKWKNITNIEQRIQFLESSSSVETYGFFSNYWLELSTSYYEHNDYEKCIKALKQYENICSDIFRKDYYLARAIPSAISSAKQIMNDNEFVLFANEYLKKLIDNTENNEWALRYYAAQIYLDIYRISKNEEYINKSYEITLNNINHLIQEQRKLNSEYIAAVVEVKPGDNSTKSEKSSIKDYNKALKEKRKTELPPVYEPLSLNLELLFALSETMGISDNEKNKIENILHGEGKLFLTDFINDKYTFNKSLKSYDAEYDKNEITVPVSAASEDIYIKVTVNNNGSTSVYTDWKISSVDRDGNDISDFKAVYTSNEAKKQSWSENSTVKVEIFENQNKATAYTVLNFKVSKYKNRVILSDVVEFEQIK